MMQQDVVTLQRMLQEREMQLMDAQRRMRSLEMAAQELDGARDAMRDRDLRDQEQGQKIRDLQMLLDRERSSRQAGDEELMRTRQERNLFQEQLRGMTSTQMAADQDATKNIKSQTELMRHLNELENMNSTLETQNQELQRQIKQLENQDDRAKEVAEMHEHLDSLEEKLHHAEEDIEEFQRENHYLKTALEEKTVQLEAAHRFEAEYDAHITEAMARKDEELSATEKQSQALAAKVASLEQEIGEVRKIAGLSGDSGSLEDLMTMVHDRDLEIENLYDRVDTLETELGQKIEEHKLMERQDFKNQDQQGLMQGAIDELRREVGDKDKRLYLLEREKSDWLASMGPEAFDLDKQLAGMRTENAHMATELSDLKQELGQYLNEASNVMYENQLLRQWSNIPPEQLLDLSEVKLKEKVSASKAVSMQRQLEKEILDLEDERLQLKMKLRSLAALASERSTIFNGMDPEQMLQLEQIAETLRRGQLEIPETDNSRELRKKVQALEKQLSNKDKQVSDMLTQHVDRKMDEVVGKVSENAQLKERVALLEKENTELKTEAGKSILMPQAQQNPQALLKMAGGLAGMMKQVGGAAGASSSKPDAQSDALQQQLAAIQKQQQDQLALFQQQMLQGARDQAGTQTSPVEEKKAATPNKLGGKLLGAAASLRRAQAEEQRKKLEETEKKLQDQEKALQAEQKKREEESKLLSDAEKAKQDAERKARELAGRFTEDERRLQEAHKAVESARKEKDAQQKAATEAAKQAAETQEVARAEIQSVAPLTPSLPSLTPAAMQAPSMFAPMVQPPPLVLPQQYIQPSARTMPMSAGGSLSAMVMPPIPGLPPSGYSQLFNQGVQMPKLLAEGSGPMSQRDACALYVQLVELSEEIARLTEANSAHKSDFDNLRGKYERLMAEREVIYQDFFKQKTGWLDEKSGLEKLAADKEEEAKSLQNQLKSLRTQYIDNATGSAAASVAGDADSAGSREKMVQLMQRVSILEEQEAKMARKYQALSEDYSSTKAALDTIEFQAGEAETYLKQKISQLALWKQRAENALRIASKKILDMVPVTEYERVNKQLQVCAQREMDLLRRQSDLYVVNAEREDRLRHLVRLEDRAQSLENISLEAEHELAQLRARLQQFDENFARECTLYRTLVASLHARVGHAGEFFYEGLFQTQDVVAPDRKVEDRLRQLDGDRDGFITLGALFDYLQSLDIDVAAEDMETIGKSVNAEGGGLGGTVTLGGSADASSGAAADVSMTGQQGGNVPWAGRRLSVLAFVAKLRLFGLQKKSGEELFWAAVRQRVPQEVNFFKMLHVFAAQDDTVKVGDIFQVFKTFGLPLEEQLAGEDLLQVATWCGYAADPTAAPHAAERQHLLHVARINYKEFVERARKRFQAASRLLDIEQEAAPGASPSATSGAGAGVGGSLAGGVQSAGPGSAGSGSAEPSARSGVNQQLSSARDGPAPNNGGAGGFLFYPETLQSEMSSMAAGYSAAQHGALPILGGTSMHHHSSLASSARGGDNRAQMSAQVAEWRMAAANRRAHTLELELKNKTATQKELSKQVGDLEALSLRLEKELHEERQRRADSEIRLTNMLEKDEVEPKLRLAESVLFENEQLKAQLAQQRDMVAVCAKQSENLERLIKRRQEEKKHLQDTVRMLQASDEIELAVGKTQYKLLLAQWERSHATRELQNVVGELRSIRAAEADTATRLDLATKNYQDEIAELRQKLSDCLIENDKLRQDVATNFTPEKAQQLSNQVEEISQRKTELERDLESVRREKNAAVAQLEMAKEQARQAQELFEDLKSSQVEDALKRGNDELAESRKKVMSLATKLSDTRLESLRCQRKLDAMAEQQENLGRSGDQKEKTIEYLQKQLAQSELRLQQEEERWRLKLREGHEVMLAIQNNATTQSKPAMGKANADGASSPTGPDGGRGSFQQQKLTIFGGGDSSMRHRWSLQSGIEDVLDKLQKKTEKVQELEEDIQRLEQNHLMLQETQQRKLKNAEVQIKLLQANLGGDDAATKFRTELLREHDEEVKKVGEAAKQSVALLQDLVDQKEEQLRTRNGQIEELQIKIKEDRGYHQQEVNALKTQLIQAESALNVQNVKLSALQQGRGGPGGQGAAASQNETALKVLREHGAMVSQAEGESQQLQRHLSTKETEIVELKQKLAERVRENELAKHEQRALDKKLQEAEKNYDASNLARIVQICRKQLKEKQAEIVKLKDTVEKWKTEQIEVEAKKLTAQDEAKQSEQQERVLRKQVRQYEDRLEDMKRRMLALQDEVIATKSKEASNAMVQRSQEASEAKLKALLEEARVAISGKMKEVDEKDARIKRLLDRVDDLEIEAEQLKKRAPGTAATASAGPPSFGSPSLGSPGSGMPTTITGLRQKLQDLEGENMRLKRKLERADSSGTGSPRAGAVAGSSLSAAETAELREALARVRRERDELKQQQSTPVSPSSSLGLAQKNDLLRLQVVKLKQRCEKSAEEYEALMRRARGMLLMVQRGYDPNLAMNLQREVRGLLEELDSNSKKVMSLDFAKMSQDLSTLTAGSSTGAPATAGSATGLIGSTSPAIASVGTVGSGEAERLNAENKRLAEQVDELGALRMKSRRLEQEVAEMETLRRRVREMSAVSPASRGMSMEEETRLRTELKQTQDKLYEAETSKTRLTREKADLASAQGAGASPSSASQAMLDRVRALEQENARLRTSSTSGFGATAAATTSPYGGSMAASSGEAIALRSQLNAAQDQVAVLDRRLREEQSAMVQLRDALAKKMAASAQQQVPGAAAVVQEQASAVATMSSKEMQGLRDKVKQFRDAYAVLGSNCTKLEKFRSDMKELVAMSSATKGSDDANRIINKLRMALSEVQYLPETPDNPDKESGNDAENALADKQRKVAQTLATVLESNQQLEAKTKKMKEALAGIEKLKTRYDGQTSIASFETASLLREVRRLAQDAREAAAVDQPVSGASAGSASASSAPGGSAATSGTAVGAAVNPADVIRKLEEERFASEDVVRELRLKMSKLEDENLALSRGKSAGEASAEATGQQLRVLEKNAEEEKTRFKGFRDNLVKSLREAQEASALAARTSPTSGLRPSPQTGMYGRPGSSMYGGISSTSGMGMGSIGSQPTTVPRTIYDKLVSAVQALLDAETQRGILAGVATTTAAATPSTLTSGASSATAVAKATSSSLVAGLGAMAVAKAATPAVAKPAGAVGVAFSSVSPTPAQATSTTGLSPLPVGGAPATASAATPPGGVSPVSASVAALQDTITSLSAENNRLRVQVRDQDTQMLSLVQQQRPPVLEGSHGAAAPGDGAAGNAATPLPIPTATSATVGPEGSAATTPTAAAGTATGGLTDAATVTPTPAAAPSINVTLSANPTQAEVELLAKKLQQTEDLYAKASSEWQRSVDRVAELSTANAKLDSKLKALDAFVKVDGERSAHASELLGRIEQIEAEKRELKAQLGEVGELKYEIKVLNAELERTGILKKRLEEELKGLEFLKLPDSKGEEISKGVDLGAGRGVRELVEKVVILEHKNQELAKDLMAMKLSGVNVPPEADAKRPKSNKDTASSGTKTSRAIGRGPTDAEMQIQKKKLDEANRVFQIELQDRQEIFARRMKTLCAELNAAHEERDAAKLREEGTLKKLKFQEEEVATLKKQVAKQDERHELDLARAGNLAHDIQVFEKGAERYKVFRQRIEWFQKNWIDDLEKLTQQTKTAVAKATASKTTGQVKAGSDKDAALDHWIDRLEMGLVYLSKYIDNEASFGGQGREQLAQSSALMRVDPRCFTDINPVEEAILAEATKKKEDAAKGKGTEDAAKEGAKTGSSDDGATKQGAASSSTDKPGTGDVPKDGDDKAADGSSAKAADESKAHAAAKATPPAPQMSEAQAKRAAMLSVITEPDELRKRALNAEDDLERATNRFQQRLAELSAVNVKLEGRMAELGSVVKVGDETAGEFFKKFDALKEENAALSARFRETDVVEAELAKVKVEKEKLDILYKRAVKDLSELEKSRTVGGGAAQKSASTERRLVDVGSGTKLQELVDKLAFLEAENDDFRKQQNQPKRQSGNYAAKGSSVIGGGGDKTQVALLQKRIEELTRVFDMEVGDRQEMFNSRLHRLGQELDKANDERRSCERAQAAAEKKVADAEALLAKTQDDLGQVRIAFEREQDKVQAAGREKSSLEQQVNVLGKKETTIVELKSEVQVVAKENERLRDWQMLSPEKHAELIAGVRQKLTLEGISFLQILKALDVQKSGLLSLRGIQKAVDMLPLSVSAQVLDTYFSEQANASLTNFLDGERIRYVEWLAALGEATVSEFEPIPLKSAGHLGLLLPSGALRGFSLRTALRIVFALFEQAEQSSDPFNMLVHVFSAFFEFLEREKVKVLVGQFLSQVEDSEKATDNNADAKSTPSSPAWKTAASSAGPGTSSETETVSKDEIARRKLLEALESALVWTLDTAFLSSRGEYEARKLRLAEELETLHMAKTDDATVLTAKSKDQGPVARLRRMLLKKQMRVRVLFDQHCTRAGFLTLADFKRMVRTELPSTPPKAQQSKIPPPPGTNATSERQGADDDSGNQPAYSDQLLEYVFEAATRKAGRTMKVGNLAAGSPTGFLQFRDFELEISGERSETQILFQKVRNGLMEKAARTTGEGMKEVSPTWFAKAMPPTHGDDEDRGTQSDMDHFLHFSGVKCNAHERALMVDECPGSAVIAAVRMSKSRKSIASSASSAPSSDTGANFSRAEFAWRVRSAHLFTTLEKLKNCFFNNKLSLLDAFLQADADRDGNLTYIEFKDLFEHQSLLKEISKTDLGSLFEILDENDTGMLPYAVLKSRLCFPEEVLAASWGDEAGDAPEEGAANDGTAASGAQAVVLPAWTDTRSRDRIERWKQAALSALRNGVIGENQPIRTLLQKLDARNSGSLTSAQFRRFVQQVVPGSDDQATQKLFQILEHTQQRQTDRMLRNTGLAPSVKIDLLIAEIQSARCEQDNKADRWVTAGPAVANIYRMLESQKLSLLKLLRDLDPLSTGRILFHSLVSMLSRQLNIPLEECRKLHQLLKLDKNGMVLCDDVSRVILREFPKKAPAVGGPTTVSSGAGGSSLNATGGSAASGMSITAQPLPPLAAGAAARFSSRTSGADQPTASSSANQAEAKLKQQVITLGKALKQAEEHKDMVEKELARMTHQSETSDHMEETLREKEKEIAALQEQVDKVEKTNSELVLEKLKSTDGYRKELFDKDGRIEALQKQLNVDAKKIVDEVKGEKKSVENELTRAQEEIERLNYEMKRVKAVRLGDEWAQREEEYMTINLKVKRLEDEKRALLGDKEEMDSSLRRAEAKSMEYLFERTQWEQKFARMEDRIRDLETTIEVGEKAGGAGIPGSSASKSSVASAPATGGKASAADAKAASRREKNLEAVVEGMEMVINKLKKDNHRQIQELERFHRETRKQGALHAENERLREKLAAKGTTSAEETLQLAEKIKSLNDTVEQCNLRNAELEEKALSLRSEKDKATAQVAELNAAREEDREALDVAQELMQDVTKTEERYRAIVSENKKMQEKLAKYQDPAFRDRLETLEIFWSSGNPLLKQATDILAALKEKYPSLSISERLLEALRGLVAAAA
ncbi:unnamed protein product [Amoebophrya sp. A25]|nr:unnamed protein product [Amoebophrya sp. A25]|eukprot:GSA25T00015274001.1